VHALHHVEHLDRAIRAVLSLHALHAFFLGSRSPTLGRALSFTTMSILPWLPVRQELLHASAQHHVYHENKNNLVSFCPSRMWLNNCANPLCRLTDLAMASLARLLVCALSLPWFSGLCLLCTARAVAVLVCVWVCEWANGNMCDMCARG